MLVHLLVRLTNIENNRRKYLKNIETSQVIWAMIVLCTLVPNSCLKSKTWRRNIWTLRKWWQCQKFQRGGTSQNSYLLGYITEPNDLICYDVYQFSTFYADLFVMEFRSVFLTFLNVLKRMTSISRIIICFN